jgi:hypothetical protein
MKISNGDTSIIPVFVKSVSTSKIEGEIKIRLAPREIPKMKVDLKTH